MGGVRVFFCFFYPPPHLHRGDLAFNVSNGVKVVEHMAIFNRALFQRADICRMQVVLCSWDFGLHLSLTLNRWQKLWQPSEQPLRLQQLSPADENHNKFPPPHAPPPPCGPPCLLRLLTETAFIQPNTRGMLTMVVHDISKISPPVLSKQLSIWCTCHLLHLGQFGPSTRECYFQSSGRSLCTLHLPPLS